MYVRWIACVATFILVLGCSTVPSADKLAREVALAYGGAHWEEVTTLSFTITRREGDQTKSVRHYRWDRTMGRLTLTENQKTRTIDLTDPASDDATALANWRVESSWLLVPFQLMEPGVTRIWRGPCDINGHSLEALEVALPAQTCTLYINPQTHRIEFVDATQAGVNLRTTWESSNAFNGIVFATSHRSAGDSDLPQARKIAAKAKANYDQAVGAESQGRDPRGVEQLMGIVSPTVIPSDELLREEEQLRELEFRLGRDDPQVIRIKRRVEQWRAVQKQEQDEARAKAKIQVLDQYKSMAEAEMGRVEVMEKHQRLTIEISDIGISRSAQ